MINSQAHHASPLLLSEFCFSTGVVLLLVGAAVGGDVNKVGALGSVGKKTGVLLGIAAVGGAGAVPFSAGGEVDTGTTGDAVVSPMSGGNVRLGRSGPGREGTGRVGSRTGGGVGCPIGLGVGAVKTVGEAVGVLVGTVVGAFVGRLVGDKVGMRVGA